MPAGHGEMLVEPAPGDWPALIAATRACREQWAFAVGGVPAPGFAAGVRAEAIAAARDFSARLGVPLSDEWEPGDPVAVTGHQPELYHPGVWVKDFLLERACRENGTLGIDLVVDTDVFDSVTIEAPCMRPSVARCKEYLALGGPDLCYACADSLTVEEVRRFVDTSAEMLDTLPAPSVGRHFREFARSLESAARDASSLAELVTFARRRYEASAGTGYLELPVTAMCRTHGYLRFAADIALRAPDFAAVYNDELAGFRSRSGIRSEAQPFPDLAVTDDLVELPFWVLRAGRRSPAFVRLRAGTLEISDADGLVVAGIPEDDPDGAVRVLHDADALLAPRALTLTMFARMFLADLFIHGVGGGRYDVVTDGVARAWFGVTAPRFVVGSLTLYLPLGAHVPTEEELRAAADDLNRIDHNPDQLLDRIDFEDDATREAARDLAREKAGLIAAIAVPDADKKAVGRRIRQVNAELAVLLAPLRTQLEERLRVLESEREAADVLTDRTYPFAFWSPSEVADKAW
jgi:hypothetical protein